MLAVVVWTFDGERWDEFDDEGRFRGWSGETEEGREGGRELISGHMMEARNAPTDIEALVRAGR